MTWDAVYQDRRWGRWPAEDVVRCVARLAAAGGRPLDVLEVGCGPGAQLWYLVHEGHAAAGIDLSVVGVTQARARLVDERLPARVVAADGRALPVRSQALDLVVDVEAFAHTPNGDAPLLWAEAARTLRPGGHVLSIGFTPATFGSDSGWVLDDGTVAGISAGPLVGVGPVAFTDEARARDLAETAGLEIAEVQVRARTVGPDHCWIEELVVLARRP